MTTAEKLPLANFDNLPAILKAKDLTIILRCSPTKVYELLNQAKEQELFPIRYIGRSPRIPRDAFLHWLKGE